MGQLSFPVVYSPEGIIQIEIGIGIAIETAAMLSPLGGIGYRLKEDSAFYGFEGIDFDPDSDFDFEETRSQQADGPGAHSSCR